MTSEYLQKVASKWFWDKETAVTAYGNLHAGMARSHYNRTFKRATLGEYSQVMVHYQYWLSTDLFIIISISQKYDKVWQIREEIFYTLDSKEEKTMVLLISRFRLDNFWCWWVLYWVYLSRLRYLFISTYFWWFIRNSFILHRHLASRLF